MTEAKVVDAKMRTLRTVAQGLAIDVLVAIVAYVLPILTDAKTWTDLPDWRIIVFTLAKTAAMAAAAYVMRRWVDKPGSPLLPTTPPGQPSQPKAEAPFEN